MKIYIKNCKIIGIIILALTILFMGLTVEETFAFNTTINATNTINSGLGLVNNGETLTLNPGTYKGTGNHDLSISKNITIRGNGSASSVIIDAEKRG